MPNTQSAKKALRQNRSRRARNTAQMRAFKDVVKKFKKAPSAEALQLLYKRADKAAKTGLIKENKAARLKSRLARKLQRKSP